MLDIGSTSYDDSWIHLEIVERCAALGRSQRLTREEISFRFLTQFAAVPERGSVLAWIGGLFISGEVTGEPVDDWALLVSRFGERVGDLAGSQIPGGPGDWIVGQFRTSFPGRRPFDLAWDEFDEFVIDAARQAGGSPGAGAPRGEEVP
jgi:hypothetical protein